MSNPNRLNATDYPYLSPDWEKGKIEAYAHRFGDTLGWNKQNSVAALDAAIKLGFRRAETDIFGTKKGEAVAYHGADGWLKKRLSGLELIEVLESMEYQEILEFLVVTEDDLPLFDRLLMEFPDVLFNADPKNDQAVAPLARVIHETSAVGRVGVSSFSDERIEGVVSELRGYNPNHRLATGFGPRGIKLLARYAFGLPVSEEEMEYLNNSEAVMFQAPHRVLTKRGVRFAHEQGREAHGWVANKKRHMKRLINNGADGIMSDRLKDFRDTLKEFGLWHEDENVESTD